MKLLDYLLSGSDVEEKENFFTNIVTSVTSVPQNLDFLDNEPALAKTLTEPSRAQEYGWFSPSGRSVTRFPRCPDCHSYYLHPENKGCFECQTCGAVGITEDAARTYDDSPGVIQ